ESRHDRLNGATGGAMDVCDVDLDRVQLQVAAQLFSQRVDAGEFFSFVFGQVGAREALVADLHAAQLHSCAGETLVLDHSVVTVSLTARTQPGGAVGIQTRIVDGPRFAQS